MGPEDLHNFISERLATKLGFLRTDLIANLVSELLQNNITEIPQFNSLIELIQETNTRHSTLEKLVHKHIRRNQVGRGEAWCLLTMPNAVKAPRSSSCDTIIETKRYEFKEQKKDIRFYNNSVTIHAITDLRKNLYIIDRALNLYYSHDLTLEWNIIGLMDKPNELNEGKLKLLSGFLIKLRSQASYFELDKWMSDAINLEKFSYDSFAETIKQGILNSFDGIVVINEDRYHLIDSTNCDGFTFKRITLGEPKFVLTIKKTLLPSPTNDTSCSISDCVPKHSGEFGGCLETKSIPIAGCDGGYPTSGLH